MRARPISDNKRLDTLRAMLTHQRTEALMKVREYRHHQEDDALPPPADELDAARSLSDVETHASLIEQAENRLKEIDDALSRVERGSYGICADCGLEIPVERLEVLPFATRCVDCQGDRNRARRGEGGIIEPFGKRWEPPAELQESSEAPRDDFVRMPEEELIIHGSRPNGPEQGRLEKPPVVGPRRPRRRK